MEVSSTIECECPNHIAQLVERLQSFKAYSRECESKNNADREFMRCTASARIEMETALSRLIAHEKIQI